jgi:hypothetical protein
MADTFIPKLASATTAAPSGSSASASLAAECPNVRLYWSGAAVAQVRWGKGSQTAVTTDMALAPGAVEVFGKQDADTLAVIGTGTLYIICGTGN